MNFKQNQTFTVTTDDHQTLTYTIQDIDSHGRLWVHSSLLERCYFISQKAFEDFLRVIGWQAASKYRLFFPKYQAFHAESFETFNQAVDRGLIFGYDFQVELDSMICATWSPLGGLRVMTEYQRWAQDQQYMLAKVEGSYP